MDKDKEIKVDYAKLKESLKDPVLKKKIDEAYAIQTRFAIITAIDNFGSANIKKLARLLGKNEATIYHHLNELKKEPALIEIDVKITNAKKGIFYKLTELAERHFGEPKTEVLEAKMMDGLKTILNRSDEEIYQIYVKMLTNHPDIGKQAEKDRIRITYNHILENIMLNNLEQAEQALMEGKKPKNKLHPFGSIANYSLDMKISKPKHVFEVLELFVKMYIKFHKLKDKIAKEMEEENIPEDKRIDFHYHIVGGEIAEFKFE